MCSQLGPSPRPDLPPTLQEPPRWPPPVQCTSSHLPGPLATTGQSPPSSPSCQPGPWKAPEATWVCSQVRKRGGHEAQPLGSSSLGLRQSEPPGSQAPRHSCGCGRSQQGPACRAAQPPSQGANSRQPAWGRRGRYCSAPGLPQRHHRQPHPAPRSHSLRVLGELAQGTGVPERFEDITWHLAPAKGFSVPLPLEPVGRRAAETEGTRHGHTRGPGTREGPAVAPHGAPKPVPAGSASGRTTLTTARGAWAEGPAWDRPARAPAARPPGGPHLGPRTALLTRGRQRRPSIRPS